MGKQGDEKAGGPGQTQLLIAIPNTVAPDIFDSDLFAADLLGPDILAET
jgi:hypothetical protein